MAADATVNPKVGGASIPIEGLSLLPHLYVELEVCYLANVIMCQSLVLS